MKACRLASGSVGTPKKPCTCGECSTIVITWVAPAVSRRSATSRAVMQMRGASFLSDRANEKYGMMAWTAFAPAPRAMSSIISSSIRWSLTGGESDCTMNTSRERTLAPSWMYRLSLLNLLTATPSSGTPSNWAMSAASGPFELPAKKRTSPGSIISTLIVVERY